MAQTTDSTDVNKKGDYREKLSLLVILFSVVGVFLLAFLVIFVSWNKTWSKDTTQMVFTAILPLFGAWVGTILAFYFGKENFEAATRSVTDIARSVGFMEKLKAIPAKDKMIPKAQMLCGTLPADQIKLLGIVDTLIKEKKGDRYPILNDTGHPVYMVHRSAIDGYLVNKARQDSPPKLATLTLQHLLDDDADLKKLFETSFATVKENATLAEAKSAMDRAAKCQDVFVTKGGTKQEPVLGWITNAIIQEVATV
jgi:hypothetical protein